MNAMNLPRCVRLLPIVCAALLASAATADSDPYSVGDPIEPFTLEDQHGISRTLDESVDILLFSRDMKGGDALKAALADAPEGFLEQRRAIYVSDLSGMPGFVTRLFAIPNMRDRGYPIWLDLDGESTARLPDEMGKATVLFVSDREITRALHLETPDEIRAALEAPAVVSD